MRFHLIGAAGYIAKKHLDAIRAVGGELVSACDPSDSVGILDAYNKKCIFGEYASDVSHLYLPGDYVVICSPNDKHYMGIEAALRNGAHAICEKPLVTREHELSKLVMPDRHNRGKIYPVLQMREHPVAMWLKDLGGPVQGSINYVTPRGSWYQQSWKAKKEQSGGLLLNIGVHLFDLMLWTFGEVDINACTAEQQAWNKASGRLVFKNVYRHVEIDWNISLDPDDCPAGIPQREFTFNGTTKSIEGVPDLHTRLYEKILTGGGYRMQDAKPALRLVWALNDKMDIPRQGNKASRVFV
jgi:UDP-N-acetyl-2-amino-2-deoxyglucuronate dehydrogenase